MMSAIPLENIVVALSQLHPPLQTLSLLFLTLSLNTFFILDKAMFTQALAIAPHLSLKGLFGMVYEHFSRCFIPKDPSSEFSKLLQSYYYCCLYPWVNGLNVGG
jgi:hypothetical protein